MIPVFDGHNDFLLRLLRDPDRREAIWLTGEGQGHLDLPRARAGGFAGGFFAVYIASPVAHDAADYEAIMDAPPYDLPLPDLIGAEAAQPVAARDDRAPDVDGAHRHAGDLPHGCGHPRRHGRRQDRRDPAFRGRRGDRRGSRRAPPLARGGPALARPGLVAAHRLRPRRAVPLPGRPRQRAGSDGRRQASDRRMQHAQAS